MTETEALKQANDALDQIDQATSSAAAAATTVKDVLTADAQKILDLSKALDDSNNGPAITALANRMVSTAGALGGLSDSLTAMGKVADPVPVPVPVPVVEPPANPPAPVDGQPQS